MIPLCTSCKREISEKELLFGSAVKFDPQTIFCGECVKAGLDKRGYLTPQPGPASSSTPPAGTPYPNLDEFTEEGAVMPDIVPSGNAPYRNSGVIAVVQSPRSPSAIISRVTGSGSGDRLPAVRAGRSGTAPAVTGSTGNFKAVGTTTGKHRAVGSKTGSHRAVGSNTARYRAVGSNTARYRAVGGQPSRQRAVGSGVRAEVADPNRAQAATVPKKDATDGLLSALGIAGACFVLVLLLVFGGSKKKPPVVEKDKKSTDVASTQVTPLPLPVPNRPVTPVPSTTNRSTPNKTTSRTSTPRRTPIDETGTMKMAPLLSEREAATEAQNLRETISADMLKTAKAYNADRPTDVPTYRRKLSDLLKSYSDTAAGEEAEQILSRLETTEKDTATPGKQSASLNWLAEWQIENLEKHAKVKMFDELGGKSLVLETHPPAIGESLRLKRKMNIQMAQPVLRLNVRGKDLGDFEFVVEIEGKRVLDEIVSGSNWQPFYINLAPLAGKEISVMIHHMPTGWDEESAFWQVPTLITSADSDGKSVTFGQAEAKRTGDVELGDNPAWKNAINLLPFVDPKQDTVQGVWSVQEDGSLLSDKSARSRIDLPYQPPAEYDFRIVFTRNDGSDPVSQIFGSRGRQMVWSIGGSGDKSSGFHSIGAGGAVENPVKIGGPLNNGRKHTSIIQVRNGQLVAYLNGKLISQTAPPTNTSAFDVKPGPLLLGIESSNNATIFHSIDVLEVGGKGKVIRTELTQASSTQRGDIKIEYEKLLTEVYSLVSAKGTEGARARIEKAQKDSFFAPLGGKLALDIKCMDYLDDMRKATLAGLNALKDKRQFTLKLTTGREINLSNTHYVASADAKSIMLEEKVGTGGASSKLDPELLSPQTRYALAGIGLSADDKEAKLKQAFAGIFLVRAAVPEFNADELKQNLKAGREKGPADVADHIQKCIDLDERERIADKAGVEIDSLVFQKKWKPAKEAIDRFKNDYLNTYSLFRMQAKVNRWEALVDHELKQPPPPPPPPPPKGAK